MEPPIQYVRTADGVNIGYWTHGQGPPLIYPPHPLWGISHSTWQLREARAWYERIGRERTLVRYDARGTGESDRDATNCSLEGYLLDLEAVVDGLQLDQFALLGYVYAAPISIAYAAQHPDRVSHLILWCATADARNYRETPRYKAFTSLRSMAADEWELYCQTMANMTYSGAEGDLPRRAAQLMMRSVNPRQSLEIIQEALTTLHTEELLPQIQTPTLVVHRQEWGWGRGDDSRQLAASIPGAKLLSQPGEAAVPYIGDIELSTGAVIGFLRGEAGGVTPPEPSASPVQTILFTDLADSTALTQRLGDDAAQELLRAHDAIVRDALRSYSGTEIKHTGDGIMASFASASAALECAVAVQRAVVAHQGPVDHAEPVEARARSPESRVPLAIHIGLNAGEPVTESDDLFGTAVQLARRICDRANAGEVLVSNVVRELTAGKGFLFADRGDATLRGFEDPVRLYELRWRDEAGTAG
jgi:class 3 adenylate cyclase/pimeloyl-ACP methyl ester carboxylesterase